MNLESQPVLFVSDVHLTPETPALTARFLHFLETVARTASVLYLLGDLFEVWIGDDDLDHFLHKQITHALSGLHQNGVAVRLMHGNRDFLLGEEFCRASGAERIADPTRIDLFGRPTLLMHGDSLCRDDHAYQALRAQMRNPAWQAAMLARSLQERRQIARQMRLESERAKQNKTYALMDVNADAVNEALRAHECTRLIHGHTHRPGRHALRIDGQDGERWVLPDWDANGRGGYLACDARGCMLMPLPAH